MKTTGFTQRLKLLWRGNYASRLAACCLTGVLFISPLASGQHTMHNMPAMDDVHVQSMPGNNEVLVAAPKSIMLNFDADVQLVKLLLKKSGKEIVDIDFRFQPGIGSHFSHDLPLLASADYYTVEWAVLNERGKLKKGNFHFSFGADARPPSFYRDKIKPMEHIRTPDYRLQ